VENWFKRYAQNKTAPAVRTRGTTPVAPPPAGGTTGTQAAFNGALVDRQIMSMIVNPLLEADKAIPAEIKEFLDSIKTDPAAQALRNAILQGKFQGILNQAAIDILTRAVTDKTKGVLIKIATEGRRAELLILLNEYVNNVRNTLNPAAGGTGSTDAVKILNDWYGRLKTAFPIVITGLGVPPSFASIPGVSSSGVSVSGQQDAQ
jgi:hypothetical protein